MNKLNNLQSGFPPHIMIEMLWILWTKYMKKHPQVLKI